jgi:hypothetical protein
VSVQAFVLAAVSADAHHWYLANSAAFLNTTIAATSRNTRRIERYAHQKVHFKYPRRAARFLATVSSLGQPGSQRASHTLKRRRPFRYATSSRSRTGLHGINAIFRHSAERARRVPAISARVLTMGAKGEGLLVKSSALNGGLFLSIRCFPSDKPCVVSSEYEAVMRCVVLSWAMSYF